MEENSLKKSSQESKSAARSNASPSNIEVGNIEVGGDVYGNIVVGHNNIIRQIINIFLGDSRAQMERRNRRVMLDHVENFWVKGVLEKSLYGAALLELGIKEDLSAVNYPWGIKKESTDETLPSGKSMLEIFNEIGLGRSLLILGAPGSGKTTMLLELARQWIRQARDDETGSIPVVFNLASWKENQTLADWLAEELNSLYYVPKKTAPAWVNENRMSLLLDGLDEVGGDRRGKCVEAINKFRKEHGLTTLTVCSRIEEYSMLKTKLSLEGAITIQPLSAAQVDAYFERFGNSFSSVRGLLQEDKALQEFAETPLILSIMALAYKDTNADALLASNNLEEQRRHLFNMYVDRMFERSNRSPNSAFTKAQTLHYLSWLARTMIHQNLITYQIEAMQPTWLEVGKQRHLYAWLVTLLCGLIGGLIVGPIMGQIGGLGRGGQISALIFGLSGGLLGGLSGVLGVWLSEGIEMVDRLTWSWKLFKSRLIEGLWYGLIGGLSSERIEDTNYPGQRLIQTFYSAISVIPIVGLTTGLIFGLIFGLFGKLNGDLSGGLREVLSEALPVSLIFGLAAGLSSVVPYGGAALIQHYTLRTFLMKNRVLPRRLIPFLEYAVDLIFLRRVGGSYIFVHRLLMEHFAEMEV